MKKRIYIFSALLIIVLVVISLYSTFALDEDNNKLEESVADYNLVYSLKENDSKIVSVASKNETYVDVTLTNTYDVTVKYGMYYHLIYPNKMPDNVKISLANTSKAILQDRIKSNETKVVSLKITNDSEYNVQLVVGAIVGFENGNIEDLVNDDVILIK